MNAPNADLAALVRDAFGAREAAGAALADAVPALVAACADLAARFSDGGTLLAFGAGGPTTDAQHVAVEFVHPVIVGKQALPAISLVADTASTMGTLHRHGPDEVIARQLEVLARPEDAAIGILAVERDVEVVRALAAARQRGLLTIALVAGVDADDDAIADHVIRVDADDAHVAKEVQVTAYHLLWEVTHVFLEHETRPDRDAAPGGSGGGSGDEDPDGLAGLYPFLGAVATIDRDGLTADAIRSSTAKADEVVALRRHVGESMAADLAACVADLGARFRVGARLLTCGNGGSSSDAQEVAQSFLAPALADLTPLPALCLTNDVATVTALSNDVAFDVVFARQVAAFGRPGDVLLGLSTSGNSENLLAAFATARDRGMVTVGFSGGDGGRMATSGLVDHLFVVPSRSVHRIQETQTTLCHVLRELLDALVDG